MNRDEVPGWPDNLLSGTLIEGQDSMETDPSQVVPDLNSSFPCGDIQMMAVGSGLSGSTNTDSCQDLNRVRSDSLSSWKSCSSLTSGYLSDENQSKSPMCFMDEDLPLSPDRTLTELKVSSPSVLETLGPTG